MSSKRYDRIVTPFVFRLTPLVLCMLLFDGIFKTFRLRKSSQTILLFTQWFQQELVWIKCQDWTSWELREIYFLLPICWKIRQRCLQRANFNCLRFGNRIIWWLSGFGALCLSLPYRLSQLLWFTAGPHYKCRGRCWAAICLSPEFSGHALHGEVDMLDNEGQHG